MDVRFHLGRRGGQKAPGPDEADLTAGLKNGTLGSLFDTVSRKHPDLAPLLEDATHQEDLEIFVNDLRLPTEAGKDYRLNDGDVVALFVKKP